MRDPMTRIPVLLAAAALMLPPATLWAASNDNIVEWSGVSHVSWQDRTPLVPRSPVSFEVRFQTWHNDITSGNVLWSGNAGSATIPASLAGQRGPYDVWRGTVPGGSSTGNYVIELTDGSDTDYWSVGGMSDGPPSDGGVVINTTTLEHAPIGATYENGTTVFKVWSPTTTSAHLRGEFNAWGLSFPMNRVGEYWIAVAGLAGQQYKYFFNNSIWNTDPRARGLDASNGPYNAIIVDPSSYPWRISDFPTPPLEKLVIYQLHVGTFAGSNDPYGSASFPATYLDVARRVGHLAELGVNAVMLNPITEFPGDESAGYNPITQWSPEWKYGAPDQFKALVDSLHAHGIAVLLDIVWNHFSPTDNFLWNYDGTQQWFDTPSVETPWGSQADFDRQAVKDYYADAALHWLQEYKLDGFRMDATSYMRISPQDASGWALMRRFNDQIDNRWADKITIAEQLPNDPAVTRPTSLSGAGFDSQYHDAFVDNLRQEIADAGTGDPEMWKISNIVQGSGAYLNGRYVLNYFQLHDEAWPTNGGQRIVRTIDPTPPFDNAAAQGRMKVALGLTLLSPGVPALLMGDEWLEDTPFGSSISDRIDWSKKAAYAPYFNCIQRLIVIRRFLDAFRADRPVNVHHFNEGGNVIGFYRTDASGTPFLVMVNVGNTTYPIYRIGAPRAGGWGQLVNTQAVVYGGGGPDNGALATEAVPYDGQAQSLVVSLPATSVLVLAPNSALDVPVEPEASSTRIERLAPVPAREGATLQFSLAAAGEVRVEVLDLGGRIVARLAQGAFAAGPHTVRWEGRDASDRAAPAGIYFVRLVTTYGIDVRRLPLLR